MRKIMSMILCAVMVLSLFAFGAFAEGPVAITTADQFKAMAADGDYYLDADITVSETYATPFTGTFDGKGHSVTVSVPLFAEMNGTVKNLVVKGLVDNSALTAEAPAHTGAVAQTINGNAVFENIKNEAVVKGMLTDFDGTYRAGAGGIAGLALKGAIVFKNCENTAEITGHAAGGILGSYDDKDKTYDKANFSVTFVNCLNTGHISASDSVKKTNAGSAGGILGIGNKISFVYFTNCKNTGKIEADKACAGPAGGITGYIYTAVTTDEAGECIFLGCVNSGEVLSSASQAGGITGWSRLHSEFIDCVNSGFIHSGTDGSGAMKGYCGGIAGRTSADKNSNTTSLFKNCLNSGKIASGRDQAAGIVAYHNSHDVTLVNCTNTGTITADTNASTKITVAGIFANHGQNETVGVGVIKAIGCVNSGELITNDVEDATLHAKEKYAAGIIAYVWGNATQYPVIENCVNTGNINNAYIDFSGQLLGYSNTVKVTITGSVGTGTITPAEGGYTSFVGANKVNVTEMTITGNKIVNADGTVWYGYAKTDGYEKIAIAEAGNEHVEFVSADAAKNAIGALGEIGYKAPAASDPVGYIAPGSGTSTPTTGDTAIWFAVVGAVALIGMAVAVKTVKSR